MPTTILVVDDDTLIRKLVGAHLRAWGYEVATASGVEEALAVLGARHVHIVLTDIEMPGRDGYDLLRILRDQHPLIRAIVLTSHDEVSTVLDVLKLGAFSFVSKPILDPEILAQAVAQAEVVLRGWLDRLASVSRRRKPSGTTAVEPHAAQTPVPESPGPLTDFLLPTDQLVPLP
ncbi:hypothetical protein LBMAG53_21340 [Planctomycetota bacterium]|nr:hypothetical protein LBMAG53_21340 [Planctomycetota bacterium]